MTFHEVSGCHGPGLRQRGVVDRRDRLTIPSEPRGSLPVQLCRERRVLERQLASEELAEERLVAVVAGSSGHGLDEGVAVRQEIQRSSG